MHMLLALRLIHIFSAAFLVGAAIFNYFLLRPALRLIPPAHAVVVAQRVGTLFTYLGWTALVLLFLSGLSRLYMLGALGILIDLELYTTSYGRSLAFMILFWFLTVVTSIYMTFVLRPKLMNKLSVNANPTLADVEKRRAAQMSSSKLLDRFQLANIITAVLALISGTSLLHNGLF
ncbi:MAG: hypothetical protein HYW03_13660 [Deltaproteobacteria bacterium]|nr:hypothetical protein [Deltaproteobacteria bacterium]